MMTLAQYQAISARTAPTHLCDEERRINAAMMIVGEFGELLDIIKKHRFQGHPLDRDALRGEFGDVMWGLAECFTIEGWTMAARIPTESTCVVQVAFIVAGEACDIAQNGVHRHGVGNSATIRLEMLTGDIVRLITEHGFTQTEVLEHNVAKLRARYPDGFSVEASINRGTP